MKEIMEKLKQVEAILTGYVGPELALNYAEDARYTYPERISSALKVLAEIEYHLTNQSNQPPGVCTCPKPKILEKSYCTQCGRDMHHPPTKVG